jgi:hypothetical protein
MRNPVHIATRFAAINLGSVSDALYRKAERFVRNYRNFNYDPASNGEQHLLRALARFEISTVFDVDANDGSWAIACSQILPNAAIHSFEIVPETSEKMVARVGCPAHSRVATRVSRVWLVGRAACGALGSETRRSSRPYGRSRARWRA